MIINLKMELMSITCSGPGCSECPEYCTVSKNPQKFYCAGHASLDDKSLEAAKALISIKEKEPYFSKLQSLKIKLKSLKKEMISSSQELIKTINNHLQEKLKEIENSFQNIEMIMNYIIINNKMFVPVIQNINSNLEKEVKASTFYLEPLASKISVFFLSLSIPLKLGLEVNFSALIDSRLINEKTPLDKKLSILSKSLGFSRESKSVSRVSIPPFDLKTLDSNILKNPSKMVVSIDFKKIFTINKKEEKLKFWDIDEKFSSNNSFSFKPRKIKDFFLIKDSKSLIVLLEESDKNYIDQKHYRFEKILIENPVLNLGHSAETGTILQSKLFNSDRFIATAIFDGKIKIWGVEDLKLDYEFQNHSAYYHGSISCFDFSSDNEQVVSGGVNGEMCLKPIFKDSPLKRYSAHSGGVTAVAFSPNCDLIVSGGEDKSIKIWKVTQSDRPFLKKDVKNLKIKEISFGVSIKTQLILTGCPKSVILWNIKENLEKIEIKEKSILLKLIHLFPDASNFSRFL